MQSTPKGSVCFTSSSVIMKKAQQHRTTQVECDSPQEQQVITAELLNMQPAKIKLFCFAFPVKYVQGFPMTNL